MTTLHTFFIIIQYNNTSVLLYFAVIVTLLYSMYPLAHCELPHNYCYRLYRIRMQELPLRGLHWYTGPTGTTGALVQLVHWYNWYIGTLVQLVQLVHWYNLCTGTTRRNVLLWKKHSFAGRQMHFFGPAHALVAWLKTFLDLRSCNLTMDETINTLNIFNSKKWNPEPYIFHVDQKTHIGAGGQTDIAVSVTVTISFLLYLIIFRQPHNVTAPRAPSQYTIFVGLNNFQWSNIYESGSPIHFILKCVVIFGWWWLYLCFWGLWVCVENVVRLGIFGACGCV